MGNMKARVSKVAYGATCAGRLGHDLSWPSLEAPRKTLMHQATKRAAKPYYHAPATPQYQQQIRLGPYLGNVATPETVVLSSARASEFVLLDFTV